MENLDRHTFICDCNSLEHQFSFWYDEELNQLYFEPHLYDTTWPWYKRFWGRLKYVFGYKSRFGAWDEVIINSKDAPKLIQYLEKIKHADIDKVAVRSIN